MGDSDIEAIRARRMAEMQQQQQQQQGGAGGYGRPSNEAQQQEREAQQAREEEMRNMILSQVLTQEARGRLSNIAVAKPEKARQLESMIIQMARYGNISGKLSDDQFRELLDKVSAQMQQKTTVTFDRRRAAMDSDDD